MIAVVQIGGKQYTVTEGQTIEVDHQDIVTGNSLEVAPLLVSDTDGKNVQVGTPTLPDAKVTFRVLEHFRGEKVTVFKIISKKRHTRSRGFRAMRTRLETTHIADKQS